MPGSPSTRLERDACATYTRRFRRLEQRIYAHPTGEPVSRSFRRRLWSRSSNFHPSIWSPVRHVSLNTAPHPFV